MSTKNSAIIHKKNIQGAPDLIIEVLSAGSKKRDRELKYKRYTNYGVKEYWIVDPDKQLLEVFDFGKNELLQIFSKNQKLNSPTFSDINLELSRIF